MIIELNNAMPHYKKISTKKSTRKETTTKSNKNNTSRQKLNILILRHLVTTSNYNQTKS